MGILRAENAAGVGSSSSTCFTIFCGMMFDTTPYSPGSEWPSLVTGHGVFAAQSLSLVNSLSQAGSRLIWQGSCTCRSGINTREVSITSSGWRRQQRSRRSTSGSCWACALISANGEALDGGKLPGNSQVSTANILYHWVPCPHCHTSV